MSKTRGGPGNSGAEDRFIELFCEVFGIEKGQYVQPQYPIQDIYGRHRYIDFALNLPDEKVAIEVDGNHWHQPDQISTDKYHDDLLKQNSIVYNGWKIYRWTSEQIDRSPERIKDELITFLGDHPLFQSLEEHLPNQLGEAFELMEHQKQALENLQNMRKEHKSIALLYHATGSGKTVTAIEDAKSLGKRTLFLAHRHELVDQAIVQFQKFWPEVSIGRFEGKDQNTKAHVICATVQSISSNLESFSADDFGYLIIDECHHSTAETYRKILSYFRPEFTLGLTATAERADGEDLLSLFQSVAHKLDLKTAVELDVLAPVRCIRIKTNIDFKDVRYNGFRYNSKDLETILEVPDRNRLIVDTYLDYVKDKPAVIFCASVKHADHIADLLRKKGVRARSVSGKTRSVEREQILKEYEAGNIQVLCSCDLLNEGWDSPHTQVLFMARPTMSRTIYLQQLGRGMRKDQDKEFLMVFDFVDNTDLYKMPCSLHRMLGLSQYRPGQLVLAKRSQREMDEVLFLKGRRPDALIEYPIHVQDYEEVQLFDWQQRAEKLISQMDFTRMVDIQSETLNRYIQEGKIKPALEVPISGSKSFRFFEKEQVEQYARQFGWTLITKENIREIFFKMVKTMTMSRSYKPVFLLSFFQNMDDKGEADLEAVAADFARFYEERKEKGLQAEIRTSLFNKESYKQSEVEKLILQMPFKRFEEMNMMRHSKALGRIHLYKPLFKALDEDDIQTIENMCFQALKKYFKDDPQ